MMKHEKSGFGKVICFLILVLLAAAAIMNRAWLMDFYRGKIYQPTDEMVVLRDSLDLTSRGRFLFDASHPELNNEEDFNYNCRSDDGEIAVLGCYTEMNIYIYNITEKRLDGIRELTTAHELLHAVYERLSPEERDSLRSDLEKVYRENQNILKEEIEVYDSAEQLEEIYVRSGTEIKKLPENLEKHFAEIFQDQDKIVDFYNKYIKVFRELEDELNKLEAEMESLNQQINSKADEYAGWADRLNSKISNFNNCADAAGCFNSEYEFNMQRAQLVSEQNSLNNLYDEIDRMINEYNAKVEKYNNNVIESKNLQNIINSHVKVKGV